jgi:Triose-phosphate Transporter family
MQMSFKVLNRVHPVSYAVSNVIQRNIVLVSSVLVFGHRLRPLSAFGCVTTAIGITMYNTAIREHNCENILASVVAVTIVAVIAFS